MKILLRVIEERQMSHLKQEFQNLDKKKQGVLDVETLRAAFLEKGYKLNSYEVEEIIRKIKTENDESSEENFPVPSIILHTNSIAPSSINDDDDFLPSNKELLFKTSNSNHPFMRDSD